MRRLTTLVLSLTLFLIAATAAGQEFVLDSSTAYFEGAKQSYVIPSPEGMRLVIDEAFVDDFSMAFVPYSEPYDSASVLIGLNIFSVQQSDSVPDVYSEIIMSDTTSLREHYGSTLIMRSIDSVLCTTGQMVDMFFIEDKTRQLPDVMIAYLNGGEEIIVVSLSIGGSYPRFLAEEGFMQCVKGLRLLKKGDPENLSITSKR